MTSACAIPANGSALSDIHYTISSSLDYQNKILITHAQVSFHTDSLLPDSLTFWRTLIEEGQELSIDSILINDTRLDLPIDGHDICIPEDSPDNLDTNDTLSSLVFSLPARGILNNGTNVIEFSYKIHFGIHPSQEEELISEGLCFADYFPRLVQTIDTILCPEQKYAHFEGIIYKIRLPNDLFLMSEAKTRCVQLDDDIIEYHVDSLKTVMPIWMTFPGTYHVHRNLGPMEADVYRDPKLRIDEEQLQNIGDAISFYESRFSGFPYDKINLMFVALPTNVGGQALNNFVFLSNRRDSLSFMEKLMLPLTETFLSTIPHEIAHLWWGGAVNIKDTWLSEGLACFWANQFEVSVNNEPAYDKIDYYGSRLFYRLRTRVPENQKEDYTNLRSYFEAPYILSMLELQMGLDSFTQTCKEFYQKYQYRSPGIAEFKEIAQEHSNVSLDSFFACWVDSNFSQNYSLDHVESKRIDSLYCNSIKLKKTGKAGSCVPIAVRYRDNAEESFLLRPEQLNREWMSRRRLASIFIDPNKLILESDRSDNAWPLELKFHSLKPNPIENINLFASFFGDEPGYHLYLLPDIPSHSERFGWDFSFVLMGQGGSGLEDYFLDDVDIMRIGYNTRSNDPLYRFFFSKSISSSTSGRSTCNLSFNRMHGRYDYGVGIKYGRYPKLSIQVPYPALRISATLTRRHYYGLENVDEKLWPTRNATPVKMQLSWLTHLSADLELERGLKIFSDDDTYYRYNFTIERQGHFYYGRVFIGTSGGDAVQERFDPSYEGGMKSYPSFRYYYDHLMSANLLLRHSLVSPINVRLFGNYINPMTGGYSVSEFGFGISLGESWGIIVDMPVYLSETLIDGKQWNWNRFRVQFHLFSPKPKRVPKWDFLIR